MREKTAMATGQAVARHPSDCCEGEVLAAALAAALVEYKKCVGNRACRQEHEVSGAQWRTLGRWEQLASARRA